MQLNILFLQILVMDITIKNIQINFFPIIRDKVRSLDISRSDEIIIYLPTYSPSNLIEVISQLPQNKKWTIFSVAVKSRDYFKS